MKEAKSFCEEIRGTKKAFAWIDAKAFFNAFYFVLHLIAVKVGVKSTLDFGLVLR